MAINSQQNAILQALGGMAAAQPGGAVSPAGQPFQPGFPNQTPINPMLLASALGQGTPQVNPGQPPQQPPLGQSRPADVFAGQGSMLDYLKAMRMWKEQGMQGPQPLPPGQAPQLPPGSI